MTICATPVFSLHFVGLFGHLFGFFAIDNRSTDRCTSAPRAVGAALDTVRRGEARPPSLALVNDQLGGNQLVLALKDSSHVCSGFNTWPEYLIDIPANELRVWIVRIDSQIAVTMRVYPGLAPLCIPALRAMRKGVVMKYVWWPPGELQDANGHESPFFAPPIQSCFRVHAELFDWVENVACNPIL